MAGRPNPTACQGHGVTSMKKIRAPLLAWLVAALTLSGWSLATRQASSRQQAENTSMVLLIPDATALRHPVTQAWLDAAQEEGVALQTMTDDAFVRAQANRQTLAGVIVPDTVHRQASNVLVSALYRYAEEGGHVLVGFDAALLDPQQGIYAAPHSRLSQLVGTAYALYEQLKSNTTAQGPVYVSREAENALAIQPGKLDFPDEQAPTWGELTTYGYKTLTYSYFKTSPDEKINTLVQSADGDVIVSTRVHGKGSVLFANLPLGYLKTRTDSYMLHRLLSYFTIEMARQPVLASTPKGLGGMVLNLHVDSNAAQAHLQSLEENGWFDDGPYSIHVTAGPDAYTAGDRMGIDLPHNAWMQGFLQRQHDKGHEIGNHGGWIHNIFGYQVHEHNKGRFEPYLNLNHQAVSLTIGERATSYSAPMGNQPDWVTDWLREHEFKAYYSTSDNGLGPTRSYIQGHPAATSGLWTFPISNFKRIATMDELHAHQLSEKEISAFITDLLDHVSRQGIARLFYFHPPVSKEYRQALESLRSSSARLQREGRFRWYSMAELSDFQNKRMAVQWHTTSSEDSGKRTITATSAVNLETMTWLIPGNSTQAPKIIEGKAQISHCNGHWKVVAGDSKFLQFEWSDQR